MEKISFVIPCYNSEKYIQNTVNSLQTVIQSKLQNYTTEIILINDGSADNTFKEISKIAEENKNVIAVDFTRNFG